MSNSFIEALLSDKTDRIPDEYDWFAKYSAEESDGVHKRTR